VYIRLIELELNPEKKLKTKIVRVISRLIAKHGWKMKFRIRC